MTDYAKVRAILDAATTGWWLGDRMVSNADGDYVCEVSGPMSNANVAADARAIVVARNLAPELLAVAEAAEDIIAEPFDLDPLRAALDALHAKMKETLT